jgi:hypothetical protein
LAAGAGVLLGLMFFGFVAPRAIGRKSKAVPLWRVLAGLTFLALLLAVAWTIRPPDLMSIGFMGSVIGLLLSDLLPARSHRPP